MQPWEKDNAPPEPFPCWKILDIESDASNASAKKARDKLLKQYHPDKVPLHISAEFKDLANRRTLEINKAYEDFTSR